MALLASSLKRELSRALIAPSLNGKLSQAFHASLSVPDESALRHWDSVHSSLPPRILLLEPNKEDCPLTSVVLHAIKAPVVDVLCRCVDVGQGCVVCRGLNEHRLAVPNGWGRVVANGQFAVKARRELSTNGEIDVLRKRDLACECD